MSEPTTSWLFWTLLFGGPLALLLATALLKSLVVLGALRVGLSARSIMPYGAVVALALVVTAVVMAPTASAIWDRVQALGGWSSVAAEEPAVLAGVLAPLRTFLQSHTDATEVAFFADLQGRAPDNPLVLVPAFVVTELTEAFVMAVMILVPFLLVDLVALQVVALVGALEANGPRLALLTLPFKLLLFVGVSGFDAVVGGIVGGYG